MRLERIDKTADYMAKFLIHSAMNGYLAYMMKDTNFYHWSLGGKASHIELFDDFPCHKLPDYLLEFYVIKLSYYSIELIYTLTYNNDKPDFGEMMLHHFVTIILVFFSYSSNFIKLGSLILLLHGISDIWVANMKVVYEISSQKSLVVAYFLMLLSFAYTRVYVLPFIVMK